MRTKVLLGVFLTAAVLLLFFLFALPSGNISVGPVTVTVNGQSVHGVEAIGIASLGIIGALVASSVALVVLALVGFGVSALVGFALLLVLGICVLVSAPVWLPVALFVAIVAWLLRKQAPVQA